jgi:hypothetical protein
MEIYMSSTSDINSSYSLWKKIETSYSDSSLYYVYHLGASGKYIFAYQKIHLSTQNSANNLRSQIYRIDKNGDIETMAYTSSLAGYDVQQYSFDCEGNLFCKVDRSYVQNNNFVHQYYVFQHNEALGDDSFRRIENVVGGATNFYIHSSLIPGTSKTLDKKGFYCFTGSNLKSASYGHPNNTGEKMIYFTPEGAPFDVTSKLPSAKHRFGYYTNGTPADRYTIGTDVGTIFGNFFYSKQSKRFMCVVMNSSTGQFTLDGTMGYKIYRSAEYEYESIDWKTLDWAKLFNANNGGQVVLEEPNGYPIGAVFQIGKEILSIPKTGYLNSKGTAGEPILKLPYGSAWGSVDGGDSWEERKTDRVDDNGNLIPNHYPFWVNGHDQRAYNGDTELHISFGFTRDTLDPFYDDEGELTILAPDPLLPYTHQMYEMPFSVVDGVQTLLWNGVQIQPPLKDGGNDDGTPVILSAALNFNGTIRNTWSSNSVVDGEVYTFRNKEVTESSWNQVFMTQGWIRANCNIPEGATDVTVMDCSGSWINTSYGSDSRTSTAGESMTYNGVLGVLVNFTDTSTISSSRRAYRVNLPAAVQYIATLEDSGIIPLD